MSPKESIGFTIALVGRPNVGKSSLFNALLGYRRTIVLDMPGTTMDDIAEKVRWSEEPLTLMDSQGLFDEGDKTVLERLVKKADAFLFVTDATSGITPFDRWVARELHVLKKPTMVCVNKIEGRGATAEGEFAELGFDNVIGTSAAHRFNLDPVKQWCLSHVETEEMPVEQTEDEPEFWFDDGTGTRGAKRRARVAKKELADELAESEEEAANPNEPKPLKFALIGRPNAGKSTLMNRLCETAVSRVSPIPHTTRDPITFDLETPHGKVKLVDTAGIRRPRSKKEQVEIFSIQASTRAIKQADVVFMMLACHEQVTDQDMRLLNLLEREGKPTVVLLNFWDKLTPPERKKFIENSDFCQYLETFRTLPMSGLTGFNVREVLPLAFRMQKQASRRVKTSRLNQVVEKIVAKNPPPHAGRQNFNILYASQVAVDPPTFVFFMNRKGAIQPSYERYLENQLRKNLGLKGHKLRLYFRGDKPASRSF